VKIQKSKFKIQMKSKNQNPNNVFNDLDLNDSFGFWALGFGFIESAIS